MVPYRQSFILFFTVARPSTNTMKTAHFSPLLFCLLTIILYLLFYFRSFDQHIHSSFPPTRVRASAKHCRDNDAGASAMASAAGLEVPSCAHVRYELIEARLCPETGGAGDGRGDSPAASLFFMIRRAASGATRWPRAARASSRVVLPPPGPPVTTNRLLIGTTSSLPPGNKGTPPICFPALFDSRQPQGPECRNHFR